MYMRDILPVEIPWAQNDGTISEVLHHTLQLPWSMGVHGAKEGIVEKAPYVPPSNHAVSVPRLT
jgi:hypothetical protein